MAILHNPVLKETAQAIKSALDKSYPDIKLSLEEIYGQITDPPNIKLGHFSYPCFPLAKVCRSAPQQIAEQLVKNIETNHLVKEAKVAGPYLNITINLEQIGKSIIGPICAKDFFSIQLVEKAKRMMFEYSQPNTHKELHVGHMRNLCLGNALVRLNKYIGNEVISATYPGDVGTHVAKCLWYLKFHNKEEPPKSHKGPWLGRLYSLASNKLEDEKGTDKEEQNRAELTTILKQLEAQSGEYFDMWKETRQWSIDLMNEVYAWADVEFDKWYFESEVDSDSLSFAKKLYEEGKFIESEGAIGMDLNDDNLGFCMMIKSDGTGMYATKDISLAHAKFADYKLDESLYVVDKRQAYHFNQVFKVLEKIGFPHYKNCYHLQYDFVELPTGAMASRKGNIIPLTDLVENMEETISKEYLSRYENEWSEQEIKKTASMVANGAIKYGMLRMDSNRKIVFDMKEWLKLDGETGPYLQYVHARINSLCEKLSHNPTDQADWSLLSKLQEEMLMLKLSSFHSAVLSSAEQSKPSYLCSYLYELGKLFNSFYVECPIGKAETEELKKARLALAKATGLVMEQGLALLGIPAPEKM